MKMIRTRKRGETPAEIAYDNWVKAQADLTRSRGILTRKKKKERVAFMRWLAACQTEDEIERIWIEAKPDDWVRRFHIAIRLARIIPVKKIPALCDKLQPEFAIAA